MPSDGPSMSAEQLRRIRKRLGLTQYEMAEKIDVRPNTLSCYERGVTPISRARAALIFGLDERTRRAEARG